MPSILGAYGLPGGTPGGITQAYQQFQNTPFYQFPLQQANLGTSRALAASGLTGSPGAIARSFGPLNAGYASQGLGQYLGGLTGIATAGQNAVGGLSSAGGNTYQPISAAYSGIGNAGAQGTYNAASSLNQGINNALPFLTGNGSGSSFGAGPAGAGGLIQQAYNGLYNPVSSLFTYGNTGGAGDAGTSALQGMGFFNPLSG